MKLRLATRGSALALWQAERTAAVLSAVGVDSELVVIESGGDRDKTTDLARFGSIGIFTVEVDRAVIDGRADVGVHSMKDMTTTLHEGVVLAGCLERGMIQDALVARDGLTLEALPPGARVGSGSLRRGAMLRSARPDVEVVPIRGNVPTRLGKVTGGELDATILAHAGLVRLGLDEHITELLDTGRFLPAVGQGIVGLTCREGDESSIDAVREHIRDETAWICATAERGFLKSMQGGCNAPIGGHAVIEDGQLTLTGHVLSMDGTQSVGGAAGIQGDPEDLLEHAEPLAINLAADLASRGATELVDAAREAARGA